MRTPLAIANWKMNKGLDEAQQFVEELLSQINHHPTVEIVICPPFTALHIVKAGVENYLVGIGGQNCFWEDRGAYTGEVSPPMLRDAGCQYVLIGHSERRLILGENDEAVNRKLTAALAGGLTPVLCVGETLQERENNLAMEVVKDQLNKALKDVQPTKQLVIAYEPVWAIGTGVNANSGDAQEMCAFIRSCMTKIFKENVADEIRILYGGSVKPDNIGEFMAEADIDGALVGGSQPGSQLIHRDREDYSECLNNQWYL